MLYFPRTDVTHPSTSKWPRPSTQSLLSVSNQPDRGTKPKSASQHPASYWWQRICGFSSSRRNVHLQTVCYDIPVGRCTDQLLNLCFISLSILCVQLRSFLLHLRSSLTDGSSFYLLLTSWHPTLPSSTSQEQVTLNGFLPFPINRKCGQVVRHWPPSALGSPYTWEVLKSWG